MSRRTLYKHLKFNNMLVDSQVWELTQAEFSLMNKDTRKKYKGYRQIRNLKLFVE